MKSAWGCLSLRRVGNAVADAVRMVPAARPPNVLTAAHQLQSRRSKTTAEYGRRKEIFPGVLELEHIYPTFPTGEENKEVKQQSRRVGVIAKKMGMTQLWDAFGTLHPVTILSISACQVAQVIDREGKLSMQVAAFNKAPRKVTKPLHGHFDSCGIPCKQFIKEFSITPDAVIPVGTEITARHFVPGQFVDITATTRGKGFAGVMKRWGFGGAPATHGTSLTHRAPGSTGMRQDPGKVFKGKKMAGHMGNKNATVENIRVYKIDVSANLIMVEGSVPGPRGGVVYLRDALKKLKSGGIIGPVPTFAGAAASAEGLHEDDLVWDLDGKNPWYVQGDDSIVKF